MNPSTAGSGAASKAPPPASTPGDSPSTPPGSASGESATGLPAPSSTPLLVARILVVDDQPANLQVLGATLGRLGHEIIPAADGPTALRRLALRTPDLILLDLLMPEMDGCEVCRRVRENPLWRDIPVIFLSAADNKDSIVRALESGGVDYLTKPFNHAELISRVRTHLELKQARDRLKQLAEDKDEILGILTHDLKSHLGGLETSARLLEERLATGPSPDSRATQLAENIGRTSGQLLTFLKEFLANSAADHGLTVQPVSMNLVEITALVLGRYRSAARRKPIELQADLPTEPLLIHADPLAVGQILDNLVSNALKFSPPGKTVTVSLVALPERVELRVRDEGPGFTEADRSRMYRRYARLTARPTGAEPSTGLGLSIVRKLVHALGGELACESVPGEGATFVVGFLRVPLAVAAEEDSTSPVEASSP